LGRFESGGLLFSDVGVTEGKVIVLSEGVWPELRGSHAAATAGYEVSDDGTATHDDESKLW